MNFNKKHFTTYWFVTAVILLLLNDFIFKQTYHNWFTGKLSDFVGLFFFPIFFAAFFKSKTKSIFIATAVFFVYFKSSFSAPFIAFFNAFAPFSIARVIDYTDLLALCILPFSYYIFKNVDQLKQIKLNPALPIFLAGFAMMSTSKPESFLEINESYEINKSKDDLIAHINTIDSQFNALSTSVYLSKELSDTVYLSLFLLDDKLCGAADLNGQISAIDSSKSIITFYEAIQACTKNKNCFPTMNCTFTNTKDEMEFVIQSNFIDLL